MKKIEEDLKFMKNVRHIKYADDPDFFHRVRSFTYLQTKYDEPGWTIMELNDEVVAVCDDDLFFLYNGWRENPLELSPQIVGMLEREFSDVPEELKTYNQWVCAMWFSANGGVENLYPIRCDQTNAKEHGLALADVHDPATWSSYQAAVEAKGRWNFPCLGFVLTEQDPFASILIEKGDQVIEWLNLYIDLKRKLNSYTENYSIPGYSPCRQILVKAKLPNGNLEGGHIHITDRADWVVITAQRTQASPKTIDPMQNKLDEVCAEYF